MSSCTMLLLASVAVLLFALLLAFLDGCARQDEQSHRTGPAQWKCM